MHKDVPVSLMEYETPFPVVAQQPLCKRMI